MALEPVVEPADEHVGLVIFGVRAEVYLAELAGAEAAVVVGAEDQLRLIARDIGRGVGLHPGEVVDRPVTVVEVA